MVNYLFIIVYFRDSEALPVNLILQFISQCILCTAL